MFQADVSAVLPHRLPLCEAHNPTRLNIRDSCAVSELLVFFFFFQAEDGIRDHCVTGVQTCALPIYMARDIERRDDDDTRSLPRWYRPEWQRTIHAEAVAYAFAVMRRAVGFGRPPLWAHVDTLGFPGDDEPAYIAKGAGLFTGAGQCGAWRYDYTIPMAELLTPRGGDVDKSNGRHRLPAVRVRT